jgi:hypothetical protein
MEVNGQFHTMATLPPPQGKNPWYSLNRMLGGPQSQSGHGGKEKNSQPLSGIYLQSSSSQPSHYTDWAIMILSISYGHINI